MRSARTPACLLAVAALASPVVACSTPPSSTPPSTCNADALAVVSGYDVASCTGSFVFDGNGFFQCGADLGADPALETSAGRAFYIARDIGKIYELDPHCGTPTGTQFVTNPSGGSLDPQDVAVAPDGTLWVPLYTVPSLIALSADGGIARTVDLSPYGPDGGGNPDATAITIVVVNGVSKAFVALEMLDNSLAMPAPYPSIPSLILPIDVTTGVAETPIPLQGRNPFGLFVPYDGKLWMAEPGSFYVSNEPLAGIEVFDPQTSTSQLLVHEADLGGSIAQVAITAGCGAAIIADSSPKNLTSLVTFDPVTGIPFTTATNPVFGPTTDYDLQGMLWVGTSLAVGNRTTTADGKFAVHVFNLTGTCTLQERPDTVFLPMQPVAFGAPI